MLKHERRLKRFGAPMLFIIKCTGNGIVEAACRKVVLKARVNWLRVVLVKPCVQFRQLLRGKLGNGVFDLPHRSKVHGFFP